MMVDHIAAARAVLRDHNLTPDTIAAHARTLAGWVLYADDCITEIEHALHTRQILKQSDETRQKAMP